MTTNAPLDKVFQDTMANRRSTWRGRNQERNYLEQILTNAVMAKLNQPKPLDIVRGIPASPVGMDDVDRDFLREQLNSVAPPLFMPTANDYWLEKALKGKILKKIERPKDAK